MDDSKMVMDNQEREEFWNTLCSLEGEDLVEDNKKIRDKIFYPEKLFRFRPATLNNIEALRTNKLFLSTSEYYDDPFDTYLRIDLKKIKSEIKDYFLNENKTQMIIEEFENKFGDTLSSQIGEFNAESVVDSLINENTLNVLSNELMNIAKEMRRNTWTICFSEDAYNETLWMKYAEQHKGFAIMYNMKEMKEKIMCGKYERCADCGINQKGFGVYPIYYSDKKYDATNYARFILLKEMEVQMQKPDLLKPLYPEKKYINWEKEKVTLIKKKCHEYDKEWRIVFNAQFESKAQMEWIPSAIILGLNMAINEKNLVVSSAREAGIKDIYETFINQDGDLDYYLISNSNKKCN